MSEGSVVDELLCLVGELSTLSSSQGCYCESAFTFLSFVQDINTSLHWQLELTNLGFSDVNVHELEEQLLGDAAASGSPSSSITTPALEKIFFTCRGEWLETHVWWLYSRSESEHAGENDLRHMFDGSTVHQNQNQDRELQYSNWS